MMLSELPAFLSFIVRGTIRYHDKMRIELSKQRLDEDKKIREQVNPIQMFIMTNYDISKDLKKSVQLISMITDCQRVLKRDIDIDEFKKHLERMGINNIYKGMVEGVKKKNKNH